MIHTEVVTAHQLAIMTRTQYDAFVMAREAAMADPDCVVSWLDNPAERHTTYMFVGNPDRIAEFRRALHDYPPDK